MDIPTGAIWLHYVCDKDQTSADQNLVDVAEVGTLICESCGDDMTLLDTVTVEE